MQRQMLKCADDKVMSSFGGYDERDLELYSPVVVHVDDENDVVAVDSDPSVLLGGVSPEQEALL
jgi:aspartate 1-decarboxylase